MTVWLVLPSQPRRDSRPPLVSDCCTWRNFDWFETRRIHSKSTDTKEKMTVPPPPPPPPAVQATKIATERRELHCEGDVCVWCPTAATKPKSTESVAQLFSQGLPWSDLQRADGTGAIAALPSTPLTMLLVSRKACSRCHDFITTVLPTLATEDLSVVYCSLDDDLDVARSQAQIAAASSGAPVYWFATATAAAAYRYLIGAMPTKPEYMLPMVLVFESATGRLVSSSGADDLADESSVDECIQRWRTGRGRPNIGPSGTGVSWSALVEGQALASLVMVAFVAASPTTDRASRDGMHAVSKFFAGDKRLTDDVSLLVVPLTSNNDNEDEWAAELGNRAIVVTNRAVGAQLADRLGATARHVGMMGPVANLFRRDTGVRISAIEAYMSIVMGDMDADEWISKAEHGQFRA
ncbi:hypothetical protein BC828DRAFT_122054 [Blastocladiella britannica]|nr:hypothetical protein BC828DRAFT_122054 [Blastocladiella britannica]